MLKYLLIPLGILTAIVLAAPQLVILGYVFLIIPGLILTIIPTVFVYLLVTLLIRWALPLPNGFGANMVSAGLAFLLGCLVMLPWRMLEIQRYENAALPNIELSEKVRLTGNVRVEFAQRLARSKSPITCDHLCTALLDVPGVESVTRVNGDSSVTFRRGPNPRGTLVPPEQPQRILDAFDKLPESQHRQGRGFEARKNLNRALLADWALRIASGDTLTKESPLANEHIDWQLSYEDVHEGGLPRVQRFEIRDRDGAVKVRQSLVLHHVPSPFFYFGFDGGSAVSGFASAKFTVASSRYSNQSRSFQFDPEVELLRSVRIHEPNPELDSIARMEEKLSEVLDNPNATDAQLLLAPMWLAMFQYDADEAHLDTIEKILLDDRISDPHELLRTALQSNLGLTRLRPGLAKRFLASNETRSRQWYVTALVDQPTGSFAEPSKDERTIWESARSVQEAAPFLERLADQGNVVVPDLLEILDDVVNEPWHKRWRILKGLREAFKRLGPDAASAIPQVRSLLEESPSPLANSARDRQEWLVALNRMGVPAEELPFGRRLTNPSQRKQETKRIHDQVQRYETELNSSAN